ncbi:hypothetical protein NDU88_001756 [Pleurodeles waltl]|uniref:Uncharacterized protein n=1 Tax=Pleurodeles waltl TaxID=8319 RepID=A0AAV7R843_PLEWA|nr:hypothetical protein NDU88_001756 [Pleurodeles waltl]
MEACAAHWTGGRGWCEVVSPALPGVGSASRRFRLGTTPPVEPGGGVLGPSRDRTCVKGAGPRWPNGAGPNGCKQGQGPRALLLKYMLFFPAQLKVLHAGRTYFIDTLEAAWEWATEERPLQGDAGGVPPPSGHTAARALKRTAREPGHSGDPRAGSRRRRRRSQKDSRYLGWGPPSPLHLPGVNGAGAAASGGIREVEPNPAYLT